MTKLREALALIKEECEKSKITLSVLLVIFHPNGS